MASGANSQNGFPYYLSPQQQQVLLQALASGDQNKETPRRPISTGAFSMSPTSLEASPQQQHLFTDIPGTSFLDGYDVDFGADTSFDFDVSNISNTVADDGNASATSDTPENENPEKRAREDEEEGSVSPSGNDAKRRENGEKVPKKPGRKPLTSEPTSVSADHS